MIFLDWYACLLSISHLLYHHSLSLTESKLVRMSLYKSHTHTPLVVFSLFSTPLFRIKSKSFSIPKWWIITRHLFMKNLLYYIFLKIITINLVSNKTVPTGCFLNVSNWMRPNYFPPLYKFSPDFFIYFLLLSPIQLLVDIPSPFALLLYPLSYLSDLPHYLTVCYIFFESSPHPYLYTTVYVLCVGYPIDWLVGSRGYQDQKHSVSFFLWGSFFSKYIFTKKNNK